MKIVYEAVDGRTFESRMECEAYEQELLAGLRIYDEDFDELKLDNLMHSTSEIKYIRIENYSALEGVNEVFTQENCWDCGPFRAPGLYYYSEKGCEWLRFTDKEIENAKSFFK